MSICVPIGLIIFLLLLFILLRLYTRLTIGRCTCNTYLAGKTAMVTGGNSGLGYQTALALAGRGCRVIIADIDNCDQTKQEIINKTGNTNIVTKYFNLAKLSSVRELAKDINRTEERLDILVNNAGVGNAGNVYTDDGFNMGMQINHFGPFLLTHLLIGLLKKSAPSRIIFVSSWCAFTNNLSIQNLNYPKEPQSNPWLDYIVYGNSKLCNLMTAQELGRKLQGTGVTANSAHPGLVYTPIFAKVHSVNKFQRFIIQLLLNWLSKNSQQGAQTAIHLALSKELDNTTGKFFSDCRPFKKPAKANDDLFVRKIWEASEKYVQLTPDERL